jgi:hypothetical protein
MVVGLVNGAGKASDSVLVNAWAVARYCKIEQYLSVEAKNVGVES